MSEREELVDTTLVALKTAWHDDYSARTVAEGVTDALLNSIWLAVRDASIREEALGEVAELVAAFEDHYRAGGGPFVQGILHAVNDFRALIDTPAQADGGGS